MSDNGAAKHWIKLRRGLSRVAAACRTELELTRTDIRSPLLASLLRTYQLEPGLFGRCEGQDEAGLYGWAWRFTRAPQPVEVEQWVDGELKQLALANEPRPDLGALGLGDGACGWRMPLAVDLRHGQHHTIELRVRFGPTLIGGVMRVLPAPPPPPPPRYDPVNGHCDGVDDGGVFGWAWRPQAPQQRVEVQQWVDGVLRAKTLANAPRQDLRDAGIGDGAYGWRMPLVLEAGDARPHRVEIIVNERNLLPNGAQNLAAAPPRANRVEEGEANGVILVCDRLEAGEMIGWAWRPGFPEQHLMVQQWVDGALVEEVIADLPRSDLARLGHGRYGWRMKLQLDPNKTEPQKVEIRAKGGPVAENGRFEIAYDPSLFLAPTAEVSPASAGSMQVQGRVDGLKGATLHGWAWDPQAPDRHVEVELWVDGERRGEVLANNFRADLRANGVGHGRYGWRLPIALDPARTEPLRIEVRTKDDGRLLADGAFELKNYSLDDPANAHLKSFVAAALRLERDPAYQPPQPKRAASTFIVYCPEQRAAGPAWAREYDDYPAAAKAFAAVLRTLGAVVEVDTLERVDAIYAACAERNEACVLLSFAPPRLAPLDLQCPVVPAFAWAYPTIPTASWDGDPRSDWRYVLRRTGRAIVFSEFAAAAVRAAMGADFPVVAIAAPSFERGPPAPLPERGVRELTVDGVVFDSREISFDPSNPNVPFPLWRGEAGLQRVNLEGVVFASVLDLGDARKNWKDLISAFTISHASRRDAVLVLKLSEANAEWWEEFYRWLVVMPKFDCRIVALRGVWSDEQWRRFVSAANWYVAAAKAEGLCLPLQTFLAAGRPAIAPRHSALADCIDPACALVVASDEEPWTWPDKEYAEGWSWTQHPSDVVPTTQHRTSWKSLVDALERAYQLSIEDHAAYEALSDEAVKAMRALCSDRVVCAQLSAFLGLDDPGRRAAPAPSQLLTAALAP